VIEPRQTLARGRVGADVAVGQGEHQREQADHTHQEAPSGRSLARGPANISAIVDRVAHPEINEADIFGVAHAVLSEIIEEI